MSDYGVTDKGFQMRRLDEIYADICKRFKDEVGVDPSRKSHSHFQQSQEVPSRPQAGVRLRLMF